MIHECGSDCILFLLLIWVVLSMPVGLSDLESPGASFGFYIKELHLIYTCYCRISQAATHLFLLLHIQVSAKIVFSKAIPIYKLIKKLYKAICKPRMHL